VFRVGSCDVALVVAVTVGVEDRREDLRLPRLLFSAGEEFLPVFNSEDSVEKKKPQK
jgi:hypothetical protein